MPCFRFFHYFYFPGKLLVPEAGLGWFFGVGGYFKYWRYSYETHSHPCAGLEYISKVCNNKRTMASLMCINYFISSLAISVSVVPVLIINR
jgi:hypothetical protein